MHDSPQHRTPIASEAEAAPLVMLPGTLCDARLYAPVLRYLGMRANVLEISGTTTAAALADILLHNLPAQFALCGFSLGAIVALEIAARAPDRVERLALIGCNPGALPALAANARRAQTRAQFVADSLNHADAAARIIIEAMADATEPGLFEQQTQITLSRTDSWPRLSAFRMPLLVVCGTEDKICPPALSMAMAQAVPHGRLALIEGAGHYVTLEQPKAVAAQISTWLATPVNTLH